MSRSSSSSYTCCRGIPSCFNQGDHALSNHATSSKAPFRPARFRSSLNVSMALIAKLPSRSSLNVSMAFSVACDGRVTDGAVEGCVEAGAVALGSVFALWNVQDSLTVDYVHSSWIESKQTGAVKCRDQPIQEGPCIVIRRSLHSQWECLILGLRSAWCCTA